MTFLQRFVAKEATTTVLGIFVTLCLVFGGAGREGLFGHGVLQAMAAMGLAILVITWPRSLKLGFAKYPALTLAAFFALGVLQCMPIPIELWANLPGREVISDGFTELGVSPRFQPVSMDMDSTVSTLLYVLPPLFAYLLALRIGMSRLRAFLPFLLMSLGAASVILGLSQVVYANPEVLYFYEYTNEGLPVGSFSNVNHQASFLLMVWPFGMYISYHLDSSTFGPDAKIAVSIVLSSVIFAIAVGLFAGGSVAGWLILVPVSVLSFFLPKRKGAEDHALLLRIGTLGFLALGVIVVATSPILEGIGITDFTDSDGSRVRIWKLSMTALEDHWLVGTGLGTFEQVLPLYEMPFEVTPVFAGKAHNEYLQIFLELGLPGMLMVVFVLLQFTLMFVRGFRERKASSDAGFRFCASIAVLAIVLHSVVDYPARTIAISVLVSICAAVMSMPTMENDGVDDPPDSHIRNPKRLVL